MVSYSIIETCQRSHYGHRTLSCERYDVNERGYRRVYSYTIYESYRQAGRTSSRQTPHTRTRIHSTTNRASAVGTYYIVDYISSNVGNWVSLSRCKLVCNVDAVDFHIFFLLSADLVICHLFALGFLFFFSPPFHYSGAFVSVRIHIQFSF